MRGRRLPSGLVFTSRAAIPVRAVRVLENPVVVGGPNHVDGQSHKMFVERSGSGQLPVLVHDEFVDLVARAAFVEAELRQFHEV